MARNHARILTSIWTDEDFLSLSAGAQRLYLMLLSQQNLSHAGLLPLTVKRWANKARNTTVEQVDAWLAELGAARYVVIDHATEELLLRSLMRRDEVWKHWKVMTAAANDVDAIASSVLRAVVAREVARMLAIEALPDASRPLLERLQVALPNPTDPQPEPEPARKGQGQGYVTVGTNVDLPPSPATAPTTSAAPPSAEVVPIRRDVETLCQTLAELMVRNGCKPPTIGDRWRDSARLLLDRDGVSLNDAVTVLGWCQADEFWRANVLSMPTFRDKYDQLRMQSARAPSDTRTRTARQLDEAQKRAEAAEAQQTRKALT